uniref:hypothetical protein n=1 Tax=Methylobacterium sp. B34 TaxID=95563 RepID=UPI000FE13ED8|nr:hypothetical protein [Methylobacterium sp. B34]
MSLTGQALLLGAMRIIDDVDSIGIAVFGVPGGNTAYVAEMDADFRIVEFMDFHNHEGYQVDYNLPGDHKLKPYILGEPTPLVFWLDGSCHIMEGNAESEDVLKIYGKRAIADPILIDLRRYLADARNGVFQDLQDQWTVEDISGAFSDIFREPPVHSRYWVTRLGEAVRHARSLTQPPHPIDDELRRVSLDWIERFATKTDFDRLMSVIGNLSSGAITSDRAQAMVFAFLINKANTGKFAEIEKRLVSSRQFINLFPQGLFHYWWRHTWPKLHFHYSKPRDIVDPLIKEIRLGEERQNFIRAERMAYLFFGKEDATNQIHDRAMPLLNKCLDDLYAAKQKGEVLFSIHRNRPRWRDHAKYILMLYHIAMALDGIMHGTHRLSRTVVDRRFGLDSFYIHELHELAEL